MGSYDISDISASPVLQQIGNTPLLRVRRVLPSYVSPDVEVYVKAEWFNPGGSVKDRPALNIVRTAIEDGSLKPGLTLMDSSSGNTAIAYAMIGAALGFPVTLVMPENVSEERKKIVAGYGAEIVYSDPLEGSDGSRDLAEKLFAKKSDKYFYADQYSNPANPEAHYKTTGPEIMRDTDGRITHFVAGMGTTGTAVGTSRYLKEKKPDVKIVALQPEQFHGIEGWKNTESAKPVRIYDPSRFDDKMTLETEPAYTWARALASKEGLLVSPSAGAAFYGAVEAIKDLDRGVVVVIFADGGDKYLSGHLYSA